MRFPESQWSVPFWKAARTVVLTATVLGLIAVILATINVVGGFVVTDRMLSMFKSKSHK